MDPWIWPLLLLVLGLGLAVLEIFFPSAGILGFLSASSILAAIALGFWRGSLVGIAILTTAVLVLPAVIVLGLKIWPKTPMGRRVMLTVPSPEDVLPVDPLKERLKLLVGKLARAKSKMLLSGVISVDGETVDAVSESVPVEPGQTVRIIAVRGNRVVVRPVDQEIPSQTAENPLMRPVDDPFDHPLT